MRKETNETNDIRFTAMRCIYVAYEKKKTQQQQQQWRMQYNSSSRNSNFKTRKEKQ